MSDYAFRDTKPLTPQVKKSLERRLKFATEYGGDEHMKKVVRKAAEHGVDWGHLLHGMTDG